MGRTLAALTQESGGEGRRRRPLPDFRRPEQIGVGGRAKKEERNVGAPGREPEGRKSASAPHTHPPIPKYSSNMSSYNYVALNNLLM